MRTPAGLVSVVDPEGETIGATLSEPPAPGQPKKFNGSCIVAHAASETEVLDEIKKDIYYKNGIWNLDKVRRQSHGISEINADNRLDSNLSCE